MSHLTIYPEGDSSTPILDTDDFDVISEELGKAGIRIQRWKADREVADDADSDESSDPSPADGTSGVRPQSWLPL